MFKVIDKELQEEVSKLDKIIQIAKASGLIETDIDQFAITEDGHLVLLDECGHFCYVDDSHFELVFLS